MSSNHRQQVWALVVWRLRHGDFVAVRTIAESMQCPAGEVQQHETTERAATRICREQVGLEVVDWQLSDRAGDSAKMLGVVTEATVELATGANWVDVEQLPMLTVIASNMDLLEAYLALKELRPENATH